MNKDIKTTKYKDTCTNCIYHYELTKEQLEGEYQGDCGCTSLETTGYCAMAFYNDCMEDFI